MLKKKKVKIRNLKPGQKPKLVIGSDCYLPRWDGIAKFLYDIIPTLSDSFEITVIAPNFEGVRKINNEITEILMPISKFKFGDYTIPKFKVKLAKQAIKDADIVWNHSIGPIGRGVINLAKKYDKTLISYIHSVEWELVSRASGKPYLYHFISIISRSYIRRLYEKCDLLMMPSYSTMHLFNWYKIKTRKVLASLGIDTTKYVPAKSLEDAKKKAGIGKDKIVIGYCGRFAHEKDLKTLIRAYLRIRDVYNNLVLLLVGSGLPEQENKFKRIRGVMLTGSTSEVIKYYQSMDIYVLPSLTETTSLSTLEAMSCGRPVLTTPVGEVDSYVKNGFNGYKFSKGNSFELSHYLKRLIDDEKLREKLGANARKTVKEKYSWKLASKKIKDVLLESV